MARVRYLKYPITDPIAGDTHCRNGSSIYIWASIATLDNLDICSAHIIILAQWICNHYFSLSGRPNIFLGCGT